MTPTLETPASEQATGSRAWFMVVALWIPSTRVTPDSLHSEMIGAQLLQHSLTRALETARVAFESAALIVPSLSRAVCSFIVTDRKAALDAITGELRSMGIAVHWVIGTRDRAEGIYRTLAPEKPAFDLNRRLATACPLAPDGNLTGEYPEMTHLTTLLKKKLADDLDYNRRLGFQPPENPS